LEEIIFDTGKLPIEKFNAGCYDVTYLLYYDPEPSRKNSIYISKQPKREFGADKNTNKACFAGVGRMLQSYETPDPYYKGPPKSDIPIPNRIFYIMNFKSAGKPELSKTERYAWLRLCKKHKLLPNYVAASTVITGKVVFDTSIVSPSLLYTYLTMMRAIVEYPAFVKAVVYLVDKVEMNFYAAFVYASMFYISNFGHHIINPSQYHGGGCHQEKFMKETSMIEFHLMAGLRRYSQDPEQYDKRCASDLSKTGWMCNGTIIKICNVRYNIKASDLFKPSLTMAIEAETDAEARKYLKKMGKEPDTKIILKRSTIKQEK